MPEPFGGSYIEKIIFKEGRTEISRAWNCTNLREIYIPASVTNWSTEYNSSVFEYTSIEKIELGDGCKYIPSYAFKNIGTLKEVVIPDSVTSIRGEAFYNCTGLSEIALPDGLKTIEGYAFKGCSGISEIVIPENVSSVGRSAFDGCENLKSIIIGKTSIPFSWHTDWLDGCKATVYNVNGEVLIEGTF